MASFMDMIRMYDGMSYDEVFKKFLESLALTYDERMKALEDRVSVLEKEAT